LVEFIDIALDWFTTKIYLCKTKPLRNILTVLSDPNHKAYDNFSTRYKDIKEILLERLQEIMEKDVIELPMMHGFGQGLLSILSSVVCSSLTYWIAAQYNHSKVDLI
jgi:hypothetical protein